MKQGDYIIKSKGHHSGKTGIVLKLLKNNSIVSGKVFPIITQGEENINIDTFQDLLIFREIIK